MYIVWFIKINISHILYLQLFKCLSAASKLESAGLQILVRMCQEYIMFVDGRGAQWMCFAEPNIKFSNILETVGAIAAASWRSGTLNREVQGRNLFSAVPTQFPLRRFAPDCH